MAKLIMNLTSQSPLFALTMVSILGGCATNDIKEPPSPTASPQSSDQSEDIYTKLASSAAPERSAVRDEYRYVLKRGNTDVPGVSYFFYQPSGEKEITGFSLRNSGSARVNQPGLGGKGSDRTYEFYFPDRAQQEIYLSIIDNVALSGRFSHDLMLREWHFFPRRLLPALSKSGDGSRLTVMLATGETVVFDTESLELVGGVLSESPIDFDPNRHTRKHPRVTYQGDFLAITSSLRGESPRRSNMWGTEVSAEVYYPTKYSKPCRLSPKYLWDQSLEPGGSEPTLQMLHATDESLYSVIEARCNWDLSALRRLSGAAKQDQPPAPKARSKSITNIGKELIQDAKERNKRAPRPGERVICIQGPDGEQCTSLE